METYNCVKVRKSDDLRWIRTMLFSFWKEGKITGIEYLKTMGNLKGYSNENKDNSNR